MNNFDQIVKSEENGDVKKPFFNNSVEDIQNKLDKKLGPEYISKRVGYGTNKVAYIEGWRAINLANQIFGYNGWKSEIKHVTVDFLDSVNGKHTVGCSAVVRVTLSDGTYREDLGYGCAENEKRKAQAFEKAKKTAVTDALKRAFREYGNALGNCLYDKQFLSKIDSVKFDPPDFDENSLFRPADEISESLTRQQTMELNQQQQYQQGRPYLPSGTESVTKKRKVEYPNRTTASNANTPFKGPVDTPPRLSSSHVAPVQTETVAKQVANQNLLNSLAAKELETMHMELNKNINDAADDDFVEDSLMSDSILEEEMFFKPKTSAPIVTNNNTTTKTTLSTEESVPAQQTVTPALTTPSSTTTDSNSNAAQEDILFKASNAEIPLIVSAKTANDFSNNAPGSLDSIAKFDHKYQTKSMKFTVDQTSSKPLSKDFLKEKGIQQQSQGNFAPPPSAAAAAAPRKMVGMPKTNFPNVRR